MRGAEFAFGVETQKHVNDINYESSKKRFISSKAIYTTTIDEHATRQSVDTRSRVRLSVPVRQAFESARAAMRLERAVPTHDHRARCESLCAPCSPRVEALLDQFEPCARRTTLRMAQDTHTTCRRA